MVKYATIVIGLTKGPIGDVLGAHGRLVDFSQRYFTEQDSGAANVPHRLQNMMEAPKEWRIANTGNT